MTAQRLLRVSLDLPSVRSGKKTCWLPVLAAVIGTLVSVLPFPVDAALLEGQTVQTTDFHGTAPDTTMIIGPVDSVVGPGVELTDFGFAGFLDVDFSDATILITAATDQPFGFLEVLRFFDVLSMIPDFTGVTVNAATNWAGFDASRIFFNSDRIDLNLTALAGLQGQQIFLNLSGGTVTPPPRPVSEPAAYLLLGIALLGMVGMGRRKSQ